MAGFTFKEVARFQKGNKKVKGSKRDKLVKKPNGAVVYEVWGNEIARLSKNGRSLKVTDADYKTNLTKDRLNKVIPSSKFISQSKFVWRVRRPNTKGEGRLWKGTERFSVGRFTRKATGTKRKVRRRK
jgi:hypothetical protein